MSSKKRWAPSPATVIAVLALFAALTGGAYAAGKAAKNTVVSKSIRNGAVKSADIANGGVRAADLGAGSVGGEEIGAGAVGGEEIASGAVGATKIAAGAVGPAELADGAVGAAELGAGAVGGPALADGSVTGTKIADGTIGSEDIGEDGVAAGEIQRQAVGGSELAGFIWSTSRSAATGDADLITNGGIVGIAKATAQCPQGTRLLWGGSRWVEATTAGQLDGNVYIQEEHMANQETAWTVQGVIDIGAQGTLRLEAQAFCLEPGLDPGAN